MKNKLLATFITTAILMVITSSSFAAPITIIGNFPQANDDRGSTIASSSGLFSKAAGFTMGDTALNLESVTLRLEVNSLEATMSLGLFGSDGADPVGPELLSFDIPVLNLGLADIIFTSSSPYVLQANTTYWIVGTGSSPTADGITWTASDPGITPTGSYAVSEGFRFDSGGQVPPTGSSSIQNTYQVNGTIAVPTPSSIILLGLGIVVLTWKRIRK